MSNGQMKLEGNNFQGEIRTMRHCFRFRLEKNMDRRSDKAPDYTIIGKAPAGHAFQAGVAWERTIQRGDNAGQSMFSLSFTDPEFGDEPLNFSAFPNNQGGYDVSLERRRQQAAPVDAATQDMPFDAAA